MLCMIAAQPHWIDVQFCDATPLHHYPAFFASAKAFSSAISFRVFSFARGNEVTHESTFAHSNCTSMLSE